MEGFELQNSSCKLYLELDPRNAIEAMMATLIVDLFNTCFSCLADGNIRSCPPHVRDINLRLGLKAAMQAADLLKKYNEMRFGSQADDRPISKVRSNRQRRHKD